MNIPILAGGITDLVALQAAVSIVLRDDPRLANVPIVPEVKFIMENDQSIDALWTLPVSAFTITTQGVTINGQGAPGLVGAGILVEMPGATSDSPEVSGPPLTWDVDIVCFEERNTNFLAGIGTGVTSEQYAQIVLDILQLQYLGPQFNTLKSKQSAINPAHDRMQLTPGIIAYRTSLRSDAGRNQTPRTQPVAATFLGGNCTLTCGDGAAAVYYTTDGTMPCSANVNAANPAGAGATLYAAPFAVTSGQSLLFAARNTAANLNISQVRSASAP